MPARRYCFRDWVAESRSVLWRVAFRALFSVSFPSPSRCCVNHITVGPEKEVRREGGSPQKEVRSNKLKIGKSKVIELKLQIDEI